MSNSSCFFLACLPFLAAVHTSAASLVYVANSSAGTISTINGQSNTVIANFSAPSPPETLAISADGAYLYLNNITAASVIQAATGNVVAEVSFYPDEIGNVALSPDGRSLWVSLTQSAQVAVIDLETDTVIAYVGVGLRPWGIAFNPTGTTAVVANTNSNSVTVIDTATLTVVTTVATGIQTTGVAVSPGGTLVYATNLADGTVSVIDLASGITRPPILVGTQPWGVAFTPDGKYAYVANGPSNNVSVISTATSSVIATISIVADGSYDRLIAISADGTRAYVLPTQPQAVSP
jgi:YVTN family beta-propeller protein